jgi:L-malate glycosyltransferase
VKVLYVNHTATIGGGERSLLELLDALPAEVVPALACPEGELAAAAEALGVPTTKIHGTSLSLRLDPLETPRAIWDLWRTAFSLRRTSHRLGADVVHANSVRAGLVAAPLARVGGPPAIVHVRDVLPSGAAGWLTRQVIRSGATLILANSDYTGETFVANGSNERVRTIHNAVDLTRFDPDRIERDAARSALRLAPNTLALGVIAQITPWKGQDDAIRMLSLLRRRLPNARLLIVGAAKFARGSESFDNRAFERTLHELVGELNLRAAVALLGERSDVPTILRALDLVLVPSWAEPFGRTIIEAMAMGTPVIATSAGGPAEIVTDGVDGVLLSPRDPARWADAAASLLGSPRLAAMGARSRQTAVARFGRKEHVEAVLAAYSDAVERGRR